MDDVTLISQAVAGYGLNSDTHRWDDLVELFMPEVAIDYTALQGGLPAVHKASELVESWKGFLPGFSGTSHLIGFPLVEIEGDHAKAQASFTATHVISETGQPDRLWMIGGRYEMGLVKLNDRWRIAEVRLVPAWQFGDRELPAEALENCTKYKTIWTNLG
jgi:hypothetical protein